MRGAIFDVDGTLLDSMPIWMDAGARYLKTLEFVPEEGLGDKLFSMTMTEGADYLNHAYGLQKELSRIITEINAIVEEFYFGEAPLKPGAMELLGQMRAAGMKLSVATSTDHHLIEGAFRRLGILEYFSGIFTCSQVGAGKDKPLIYEMAAQAMGTKPAETCVLEDALHALVTAKKAGFFAIGIYDEASAAKQEELQKEADLYGKSLSDILEKLKEEQKL